MNIRNIQPPNESVIGQIRKSNVIIVAFDIVSICVADGVGKRLVVWVGAFVGVVCGVGIGVVGGIVGKVPPVRVLK